MSDERNIELALKKIFAEKKEIFAWKTNDTTIQQSYLTPKKISKNSLTFSIDPHNRLLIEDLINEKRDLKLYCQDSALFLHVKLRALEEDIIEVSKPLNFEFEDRRQKGRKDQFQGLHVKIFHQEASFTKACSDFGPGGFSIVCMKSENNPFKNIGMLLDLEIIEFEIKAKAELVKIDVIKPFEFSSTPYGGKRLAFKFVKEDDNLNKRLMKIFNSIK